VLSFRGKRDNGIICQELVYSEMLIVGSCNGFGAFQFVMCDRE